MKFKKTIAILLLAMMMLSIISPILVFASASMANPIISVESIADTAGSTIDVAVNIENNTELLGVKLTFTYGDGLTLINATNGDAFPALTLTKPGKLVSPCNFVWDGQDVTSEDVKDGTILTLQFKIDDDAEAGDVYNIKISYDRDDIIDPSFNPVDIEVINGAVSVVDYLPGDLNGDLEINTTDIVLLRRDVTGGYEQIINTSAADVNGDGKRNTTDIVLVRRHVTGGYDVNLIPSKPQCQHELEEHPYKAPTQSEAGNIAYWSCSKCNKLFSDANGTREIKEADTVISPLEGYTITYYIDNNDEYLKSINIDNPNPSYYEKGESVELLDLLVPGYNFVGWYTAQIGGTKVTAINSTETGNKVLYAHWEKITYSISYESNMVPITGDEYKSYTVGVAKTLPTPALDKYTFVGWTDKDGKLWKDIPMGTTGNIILYANWASNRNKAVAKKELDKPIIIEDTENNLILFTYEIGEIQNVPLFTLFKLNNAAGVISSTTRTNEKSISTTNATTIAKTIAKETTNSSSWSLSNDWNSTTQVSQEYLEQTNMSREEAESLAKNESGSYSVSSSNGGKKGIITVDGTVYNKSDNTSHSNSTTDTSSATIGVSADVKGNFGFAEVGFDIDTEFQGTESSTGTTGGYTIEDNETTHSESITDEKNWNTSSGYSSSQSISANQSVSSSISKLISDKYNYGQSYSEGGSNSSAQSFANSESQSNNYSNAFTYYNSEITYEKNEYSTTGNNFGDYRLVMSGKVHVFAVVGYDIAQKTYFVYTYNVLDDMAQEYLDYSYDGTFDDYETSVIPFEVPIFVNDYVNSKIAKTEGLKFDLDTGTVVDYVPSDSENPDDIIIIPSYVSVDNGDGTYGAVKITSMSEGLFKNNTALKAIRLSSFMDTIPDSAFEGCSSLEYISCNNITNIGSKAFSGCTSLGEFSIPSKVSNVGISAFEGVPNIKASAQNLSVAQVVAALGADNIVVDISQIPDNEAINMSFNINTAKSFELQGKDKIYKGLSVKSNAETTIINGVNITENVGIPIDLTSSNVSLDRVNVECSGYGMVLRANNTNIKLNRTNSIISSSDNAILAKNVNFNDFGGSVVGKMNISGNLCTCGTVSGEIYLNFISTEYGVKNITEDEYNNPGTSFVIHFDANGGTVDVKTKDAYDYMAVGELPVPEWNNYPFVGWYTAKTGGTKVTESTIITSSEDVTLYARWGIWDGSSKEPSYNPDTMTYSITSGEELEWIRRVCAGEITSGNNMPTDVTFNGYKIELNNNICLNYYDNYDNWIDVVPENSWSYTGEEFGGTFDGKNNIIYGLYGVSLFGIITETGSVKNLTLKYGTTMQASIAYSNLGNIYNCHNESCIVTGYGTKNGLDGAGGIAKINWGKISYCSNKASVGCKSTSLYSGGIVGCSWGEIEYCYNKGTVSNCSNSGGIVGCITGGNPTELDLHVLGCYNTGNICGSKNVGGIIGSNSVREYESNDLIGKTFKIEGCYNTGTVIGYDSSKIGGIIGEVYAMTYIGGIYDCYNVGELSGDYIQSGKYVGCYYDDIPENFVMISMNIDRCWGDKNASASSGGYYPNYNYVGYYGEPYPIADFTITNMIFNLHYFDGTPYYSIDNSINNGNPYIKELVDSYK